MFIDSSSEDDEDRPKIPRVYRNQNTLDKYTDRGVVEHFRLTRGTIIELAELIKEKIGPKYESRSTDIDHVFKLQIALFFYATGDHQRTIAQGCGIRQSTVSTAINTVTNALLELAPNFVKLPNAADLNTIKAAFYRKSNMPRIIGAIDGTLLPLQRPANELNYGYVSRKGQISLNAMGVCDNNRKFISFLCDYPGSCHDSYVLRCSKFYDKMEREPLDGIFLGDSGYPLRKWLFPPVRIPRSESEERYNVAHRHTRVIIEQCFGIFKQRFRCLQNKCRLSPEKLCKVATVCAFLHNVAIDSNAPLPPLEQMEEEEDEEQQQQQEVAGDDANVAVNIRDDYIRNNF